MQKYIPSLNGFRAISILLVIGHHLNQVGYFNFHKNIKLIATVFFNGSFAVNIFLIISGYLITTLMIQEEKKNSSISLKKFYFRRIFRIFPAYYTLLLVYFILQKFQYLQLNYWDWISCLTFTKQFYASNTFETSHLWSLSVEEFFYFLWPLSFVYFTSHRKVILIIFAIVIVFSRIYFYKFPYSEISNTIFSTGDALALGCLGAILRKDFLSKISENSFYISMCILIISLLSGKYSSFLLKQGDALNEEYSLISALVYTFLGNIGLITNITMLIIILYSLSEKSILFYLLNSKPFNYIGKLSYSIYLWQQLIIYKFNPSIKTLPIALVCIFIFAIISYYFIELPFLKYKDKFKVS